IEIRRQPRHGGRRGAAVAEATEIAGRLRGLLQPAEPPAGPQERRHDPATAAHRLAVRRTVRPAANGVEGPAVPAAAAATHHVSHGAAGPGDHAGSPARKGIFTSTRGYTATANWLAE